MWRDRSDRTAKKWWRRGNKVSTFWRDWYDETKTQKWNEEGTEKMHVLLKNDDLMAKMESGDLAFLSTIH